MIALTAVVSEERRCHLGELKREGNVKHFRDIMFYLKSAVKGSKEIVGIFLLYILAGTVITSLAYASVGNWATDDKYCEWKPNRVASGIYWTIEFLPRKTTCFLWEPFGEE